MTQETGDVAPTQEQPDLAGRLGELTAAVAAMGAELARHHERAAARELVIDRLHEDNQRLRAGERQSLLRPVLVDLQRLRNDLLKQAADLPTGMPTAAVAALLESFAVSVAQALERCGVEVVRPAGGDAFDLRRHRASYTVEADAPEQDATVAEVVADGYVDAVEGRVLLPATVRVYRWVPDVTGSSQAATQ